MSMTTAVISGNISWPAPSTPYSIPANKTQHDAKIQFASEAMKGLLGRADSYLLTDSELVERAWILADLMVVKAQSRGLISY